MAIDSIIEITETPKMASDSQVLPYISVLRALSFLQKYTVRVDSCFYSFVYIFPIMHFHS